MKKVFRYIRKNKNVKERKKRKIVESKSEGSYLIEAAVILPVFLLGVIFLISVIAIEDVKENIYHSSCDELRYSMISCYMYDDTLLLPHRLERRLNSENSSKTIKNITVKGDLFGAYLGGDSGQIRFKVIHEVGLKLPYPFNRTYSKEYSFMGRKFIGDNRRKDFKGYEYFEKYMESDIVYIFPEDGQKYHKKNCTHIEPDVTEIVLTDDYRSRYNACRVCDAKSAKNGTIVYIFENYGDMYHLESCQSVKRNYISIDRELAIKEGYSPCSKCGG